VNAQLGFLLIALIWKFDFSPFMILVIAILNDGKFAVQLQKHTVAVAYLLTIISAHPVLIILK
jgi:hypothetical protein